MFSPHEVRGDLFVNDARDAVWNRQPLAALISQPLNLMAKMFVVWAEKRFVVWWLSPRQFRDLLIFFWRGIWRHCKDTFRACARWRGSSRSPCLRVGARGVGLPAKKSLVTGPASSTCPPAPLHVPVAHGAGTALCSYPSGGSPTCRPARIGVHGTSDNLRMRTRYLTSKTTREVHFQVKSVKTEGIGPLWKFRCRFAWQAQGIVHLVKSEQNVSKMWGFCGSVNYNYNDNTLHYTTLHYILLHCTTLD